ncbi:MAG TPA: hypothetical protein VIH59_25970 [Candidatus Tectomicrobia bacterium]|jgi:hypothetical protein
MRGGQKRCVRLTATEQVQLEHTFNTTTERRLRDRCKAVLMASRGRKRWTIAQDLGVHGTTAAAGQLGLTAGLLGNNRLEGVTLFP